MTSENCSFSEESPPTVQNSEDKSRKWYSVQWADFKLCCRQLKGVSTQHPRIPFCVYALYRFAIAVYFLATLITYVVLATETHGPMFLIYFENWAYIAATCYVCFAAFNVMMNTVKSREHAALEDKFRYQIQWFLFNIIAAPSIIISAFTWVPLYLAVLEKDTISIFFHVSMYLLPNVVCLVEIFLTLIVVRFVHVVYPVSVMIVYLLFVVTYWAAGGTDPFGNHYIYFFLAFGIDPGIAAATLVSASLAILLAQAILKGLYALRVRCIDRRRREAVRATRQGEAETAELKALTT